jgi:hypothetical protein
MSNPNTQEELKNILSKVFKGFSIVRAEKTSNFFETVGGSILITFPTKREIKIFAPFDNSSAQEIAVQVFNKYLGTISVKKVMSEDFSDCEDFLNEKFYMAFLNAKVLRREFSLDDFDCIEGVVSVLAKPFYN